MDLGVSSMQLDAAGRGFSFQRDEVLDMRMDTSAGPTAAQMLADADEQTLADVIYEFGEERYARRIARAIVTARATAPIETTGRLADITRRAVPRRGYTRIDPATRTFQAVRIWVNRELDGLDVFLREAAQRLPREGVSRCCRSIRWRTGSSSTRFARCRPRLPPLVRVLTKRPAVPTEAEIVAQPAGTQREAAGSRSGMSQKAARSRHDD